MRKKYEVMFLRLHVVVSEEITERLTPYYSSGWRVVSHADLDGEYSFVLEREHEPR